MSSRAPSIEGLLRRLDDELLPSILGPRSAASSPTIGDVPSLAREGTRSPLSSEGTGLTGFLLLRALLRDLHDAVAADFSGRVEGVAAAPRASWNPAELRAHLASYAVPTGTPNAAEPSETTLAHKAAPILTTLPTSVLLSRIAGVVVDMLELVSPNERHVVPLGAPHTHASSSSATSSPTDVLFMEDFDSLQGTEPLFDDSELVAPQGRPELHHGQPTASSTEATASGPDVNEGKDTIDPPLRRGGKRRRDGLDTESSHHRKKTTIYRQFQRHASAMDATLTALSARLYASMTERDTLFPLQSLAFALCQPVVRMLCQEIDRCADAKCKRMFADFVEEVHERHDVDFFPLDTRLQDDETMLDPYGTAGSSPTNRNASDKSTEEFHGRGSFTRCANRGATLSSSSSVGYGGGGGGATAYRAVVSSMPSDSFVKELSNSIPVGGMFDPLASDNEHSYLSIPPPLLSIPSSRQATGDAAISRNAFTTAPARLSPESSVSSAARPTSVRDSWQPSPPRSPTSAVGGATNRNVSFSASSSPISASSPQVFPTKPGACATNTALYAKLSSTAPRRLGSAGQKTPATQVKKAGEIPAYMLTKKRCPPSASSAGTVPPPPPAKQRPGSGGGALPASSSSSARVPATHQVWIREAWQRSSGLTDSTYRLPNTERAEHSAQTLPRLVLSDGPGTPPTKPAISTPPLLPTDGLRQDRILFCDDDD